MVFLFTCKSGIVYFESILSKRDNALDGFLNPGAPQGPVIECEMLLRLDLLCRSE